MPIDDLILGLGFVAVIEGLVIALAPNRLEDLVTQLAKIPVDARRWGGLFIVILGVFLVWVARG